MVAPRRDLDYVAGLGNRAGRCCSGESTTLPPALPITDHPLVLWRGPRQIAVGHDEEIATLYQVAPEMALERGLAATDLANRDNIVPNLAVLGAQIVMERKLGRRSWPPQGA